VESNDSKRRTKKGLEEFILVFKFWFRNGTYIEKRVHITDENVDNFTPLEKFKNTFKSVFSEDNCGHVAIDQFVARVSDVIAFDIDIEEVRHDSK
jgi:hypothetical protein